MASMGIYIFNTQLLIPILLADPRIPSPATILARTILPRIISKHAVFAYNFVDENAKDALYWRDVGTLDASTKRNMDLVSVSPVFNLYDTSWPLAPGSRYPPAKLCLRRSGAHGRRPPIPSSPGLRHLRWAAFKNPYRQQRSASTVTSESLGFHHLQSRECRPLLAHPPR